MIDLDNEIEQIKRRIKDKRYKETNTNIEPTTNIKYFKNLLSRTLITIILILMSVIYINSDDKNLLSFKKEVLEKNLSFAPFKEWYQKKFGKIIPIDLEEETQVVFSDKLNFSNIENYLDGFKLSVANNTVINNITSGIVVYSGEKEGYGNAIIVQGIDGVDIWYGNILNTSVALYDYIEANTILGEANGDYLYLVLSKNGEYLNYEEYMENNKNQ